MNHRAKRKSRIVGFTLIEALVALLVLTALMGAVFSMINKTQANYRVQSQQVDFTQQQRELIDEFTRDMHQAGYPNPVSTQGLVSAPFTGIQAFTNTSVTMQGDLDGTGQQTITYDYNPACNCMERTVVSAGTPAVVAAENVVAPGPEEIFTAYDINGNVLPAPVNLASIRSIRITFTVQGGVDMSGKSLIQNSMTGMARLPNNN